MEAPMFFLPKGIPLFENTETTQLKLPDILSKLGSTVFTGYVSFVFPSSTGHLVFETGKLTSVVFEEDNGTRLTSLDALITLAGHMLTSDNGSINAYKLSSDLGFHTGQLIRSETLFRGKELETFNIREMLGQIRDERISGCLRVYTDDKSSLIFYRDGNPLGFFHDCSFDMETTANETQRITSLPNAKIDLFSSRRAENTMGIDLLEIINIRKMWYCVVANHQA
jgi:hypothetical protein